MAYGYCRTPGHESLLDAYRAELWGMLVSLHFVRYIQDRCEVESGSVLMVCDCQGAIRSGFEFQFPASIKAQHYDILQEIFYIKQHLKLIVTCEWVKGHQKLSIVDQHARMNREVDGLAKKFLSYCASKPKTQVTLTPGSFHWHASIEGITIVKSFSDLILEHSHKNELF